jgi:hypothetical protein
MLLALALRSDDDELLKTLCGPLASRAFGPTLCSVDAFYTACVYNHIPWPHNTPGAIFTEETVTISRESDMAHSYYAVVSLTDGAQVENAFDYFTVTLGGQEAERRSLSRTIAMCKAKNCWPSFTNRGRVAYIPLLIDAPAVVPLVAMIWHDMTIRFHGVHSKLDSVVHEYVYLDSAARRATANLGPTTHFAFTKRATAVERPSKEVPFHYDGHSKDIGVGDLEKTVRAPTTAFFISLHFDHPIDADDHPLRSAFLRIKTLFTGRLAFHDGYNFDAAMLEEVNWQRCGLIPPTESYKKKEMRQDFLYLMPFSREAFADPPTSWINFANFHGAELCLKLARDDYGEITGVIAAETIALRIYGTGMSAQLAYPLPHSVITIIEARERAEAEALLIMQEQAEAAAAAHQDELIIGNAPAPWQAYGEEDVHGSKKR